MRAAFAFLCCALMVASPGNLRARAAEADTAPAGVDTAAAADPQMAREALDYHERLTAPIFDVRKASYSYEQAIMKLRRAKTVDRKRQDMLKVIRTMKDALADQRPFHGDSTLKLQLVGYLDLLAIVLKEDFGKILDMEDIAAQTFDQEEAHQLALDLAVDKLNKSGDVLRNAEKAFFEKYGIVSKELHDELSARIDRANKALSYYNAISRIISKVNREDNYASEAVHHKDVAGLAQHATTLVSLSEDAFEQLKQDTAYEKDTTLTASASALMAFFKQEGSVRYPANVEFTMKSDNIHEAGKKLAAIRQEDRKKEDVDKYNSAVNEYNDAVREINRINDIAYKTHKKLLKQWQDAAAGFFERHS